jgi:hypothetical protein
LKPPLIPSPLAPQFRYATRLAPCTLQPMVTRSHHQPAPCRSGNITMGLIHPPESRHLPAWKPTVSKLPGMNPELLPIQVPHLKDHVTSKQGVRMIPAPVPRYQPCKPLLKLQKGLPIGQIPTRFKANTGGVGR